MLGVAFDVRPAHVEEVEQGDPAEVALENARRKGEATTGAHVVACDTVVALDGRLYPKPRDRAAAEATLRTLSGRTHEVVSALWVDGRSDVERTAVTFVDIAENRLRWYLDSGEWEDRAGAYAIQGRGAALVARIEGEYHNVVGFPVQAFLRLLPQALAREQG
jgi:septum formation protein